MPMRMTRFELTLGEQANLAALTAAVPLLSYYLAVEDRTFAVPVAVGLALVVASWLAGAVYMHQPLSGAHALLIVSLSCLAFSPHAADRLFWLLMGTATMLALLIHNLVNHAPKSVTGSMPTVLQLTILPAIYYSAAVDYPAHVTTTGVALALLAVALLCNLCVRPRSRTSWLLSATEALLLAVILTPTLPMMSLVIRVAMYLAAFGYFFALHFLFADAGEVRDAHGGGVGRGPLPDTRQRV